ncbi:hypothetical protein WN944_023758 [Citrus x changshan-huyou]|uniref:Uncharacterized protein n=1 Tax=Citrus x changshan-huyou TaxID=2935761 RepID=A0AAP0LR51_9ROSI
MLMLKSDHPLPDQIVPPTLVWSMEKILPSLCFKFSLPSPSFLIIFFIGLLRSYSHHPTFSKYSSCPNFQFGAWRNYRDFVRSCPLSLGDEHLVGTFLLSVLVSSWHMPVHDVLPGLCSCHSAGEIRLRVRDEDIADLVITLINNSLSGSLPSRIDFSLPTIEVLVLALNRFSRTIPSSITNASKLTVLKLGGNTFSGFIPNTIGNLRNLEWLSLANNSLTSSTSKLSFLSSLGNCKKLRFLNLAGNPLDGFLPSSMGNLSMSLKTLLIANCSIVSNIPQAISNLSNLLALVLERNKLIGPIPITFGRLQKLQGL